MSTASKMLLTLVAIPCLYALHSLYLVCRQYRHYSRVLSIPLIAVPLEPSTIAAQTLLPILFSITDRFIALSDYPTWMVPMRAGWQQIDATTTRLFSNGSWWNGKGDNRPLPAIAIVSPAGLSVHICDPSAIVQMLETRDRGSGYGVARDPNMYSVLSVYGPCLSTAENADWPRHRKALAPPFNENVMAEVWDESRAQTRALVEAWSEASASGGIDCVATDLRTITLNVLAAVGFRRPAEFVSAVHKPATDDVAGNAVTFRDALATVLDNALVFLVVPMTVLLWPIWSKKMQTLGRAGQQLERHMDAMLDDELASADRGEQGSGGIMTALLHALKTNSKEQKDSSGTATPASVKCGLNREECRGNIFIVSFAGHDRPALEPFFPTLRMLERTLADILRTTANALAFAALSLVAHPEVQQWVGEEIEHFARDMPVSEWDYRAIYPRLRRCQAVLFETLRLYPAVWSIPRKTSRQPYRMNVSFGLDKEREVIVPPGSYIGAAVVSVHTQPTIWGDDAECWCPSRWIDDREASTGPENEQLIEPQRGSFSPWSHGPQNCLGQKFSQVEFVAILVELLAYHRLEAVPEPGEEPDETRQRVMATLRDIEIVMLVKLRKGDSVRMRLKAV